VVTGIKSRDSLKSLLPLNDGLVVKVLSDAILLQNLRLSKNVLDSITQLLMMDLEFGWSGENSVSAFFENHHGIDRLEKLKMGSNY